MSRFFGVTVCKEFQLRFCSTTPSGVSNKFAGCAGCACWLVWQWHQNFVLIGASVGELSKGQWSSTPDFSRLNTDHFLVSPSVLKLRRSEPKRPNENQERVQRRVEMSSLHFKYQGFWSCFTQKVPANRAATNTNEKAKHQTRPAQKKIFCFEHSKP